MKSNRGLALLGVIAYVALAGVAVFIFKGTTDKGSNTHWWNPATILSHKPADVADKAKAAAEAAEKAAQAAKDAALHKAHKEIYKASVAQGSLPDSRATDLDRRFTGNGLGLLDQIDPLTANDHAESLAIVQGLLSAETIKREAAEAKQLTAEKDLAKTSTLLEQKTAEAKTTREALGAAGDKLRDAFERENGLANQLRNEQMFKRVAIVGVVLLLLLVLYLRSGLTSVGAALHAAPKYIGQANADKLTVLFDIEADKLHQRMVGKGWSKAKTKAQDAAEIVSTTPLSPP